MKIILSRKGFDSASGGVASPILPNGALVSLPIPDPSATTTYAGIRHAGLGLGPMVDALTKGRITARHRAHLDPDLLHDSRVRPAGWRPLFGQSGAAQGHLAHQGVGPGDLFIFFGWFRRIRFEKKKSFVLKDAPNQHIIFGWLQIGRILDLNREPGEAWMHGHPHFHGKRGVNNVLYEAAPRLNLPGDPPDLAGAGVFPRVEPQLILTAPGKTRSHWRLPSWLHPEGRRSCLSYHQRIERWQKDADGVQLKSTARGQDFVLDCDHYPEVFGWLRELFQAAKTENAQQDHSRLTGPEFAGKRLSK